MDAEGQSLDGVQGEPPTGQGEGILIVEDDTQLLAMDEERVAALGYEPIGFGGSMQALTAFRANRGRFDLVLSDGIMPEMTGMELASVATRAPGDPGHRSGRAALGGCVARC